jgi:hypothetical protein
MFGSAEAGEAGRSDPILFLTSQAHSLSSPPLSVVVPAET